MNHTKLVEIMIEFLVGLVAILSVLVVLYGVGLLVLTGISWHPRAATFRKEFEDSKKDPFVALLAVAVGFNVITLTGLVLGLVCAIGTVILHGG